MNPTNGKEMIVMRDYSRVYVLVVVGLVLFTGCSRGKGPLTPMDPAREVETFSGGDMYEIFSDDYIDIDLAPLRQYSTGDPATVNGYEWVAAVSLEDEGASPPTRIPVYRWLENDTPSDGYGPAIDPDALGVGSETYKLPKADACYFPADDIIELAVCYVWVKSGANPTQEIGVTVSLWEDANFPEGDPDALSTWNWDISPTEGFEPDIAYDTETGDLYVTYAKMVVAEHPRRLYYRRYDHGNETWSAENCLCSGGNPHDAYNPRIDVGIVTDIDENYSGDCNMVGIAYSGYHFDGDHTNDVCWVYWETSESDGSDKWESASDLGRSDVCLPYIDISPDSNSEHYFAVVWQEYNSGDAHYEVYEVDNLHNTPVLIKRPSENHEGVQPSIAVHYDDVVDGDHEASICLMERTGQLVYQPYVMLIVLNDGYYIGNSFFPLSPTVSGSWSTAIVSLSWRGVATAIIDTSDNYLWAGYAGSLSGLTNINAAYGNAYPG